MKQVYWSAFGALISFSLMLSFMWDIRYENHHYYLNMYGMIGCAILFVVQLEETLNIYNYVKRGKLIKSGELK